MRLLSLNAYLWMPSGSYSGFVGLLVPSSMPVQPAHGGHGVVAPKLAVVGRPLVSFVSYNESPLLEFPFRAEVTVLYTVRVTWPPVLVPVHLTKR